MNFTITLVHAPGALEAEHWAAFRRRAPGAHDHEVRLVADEPGDAVSGASLDRALRDFLQAPNLQLSTAGTALHSIDAGSALLHRGMVVLASPPGIPMRRLRPSQLTLCVDSGPDAGRLIPLRRGRTEIGRGRSDIRTADPAMSRKEAVLHVGKRAITLHRTHTNNDDATTVRLTTEDDFQLGSTQCRITVEAPPSRTRHSWPPAAEPVGVGPPESKHKMMLAFALVPLVAGIVLVAFTGMWFFLLFSGASALVASVIFWDGRRKQRQYRHHIARAARLWASRTFSALCSPGELIRLLRANTGESVHAGAAEDRAPAVRLGTGQVSATVDFGSASSPEDQDTQVHAAVGVTLYPGEQTILHGPERAAHRLLRWILVQLALNPVQPQVVVVGGLRMPDLRDFARVTQLSPETFLSVLNTTPEEAEHPRVVIVFEPGVDRCVHRAVAASWHVVTLGAGKLNVDGWWVDLALGVLERQTTEGSSEVRAQKFSFDGLSQETAHQHLRHALPLLGGVASAGELPANCTYRLPAQMFTETAAESLIAVLGRDRSERVTLDLVGDGPHILVAGTTGSGKSELLKTLLVSLCARYGPRELGLVLIDFKGGAAFHQIDQLEHSLGLVTDLSHAAAERTLEGIRSELVRRERLFLDAGAGDYCQYRGLRPDQPLARILVVIDEFRIFSHELPDQLDELMRLATLGRSLGLHLVLSTQRPQGVVTADIRANIGSSICLRVRGEDESRDVIGSPVAATIPRSVPGRAALKTPGEEPVLFQSAQLAGHRPLQLRPEVRSGQSPPLENFSDVVAAVAEASTAQQQHRGHTPLLPALPETLRAEDRLAHDVATSALLGRVDDPAGQRQEDLLLDAAEPMSLALIGEVGSGASEATAAVAAQILITQPETDVYLLDGDRSLAKMADHPRVGSWLTEEDTPEVEYLLGALMDELTSRRAEGTHLPEERRRPLQVVVTGYAQWHAASQMRLQTLDHLLGTLAAEGPQAGISVLISGGRELALGKLTGRIPTRIYLPLGTSDEARYLWPTIRSTDAVPGRGVLLTPQIPPPGLSVQLVTEQPRIRKAPGSTRTPRLQVQPLPERLLTPDIMEREETGSVETPEPVVGIMQFTGAPARLRLGPVNLILGSSGTGKTTCLQALREQLRGSFLLTPGCTLPTHMPAALLVDDAPACSTEQHAFIHHALAKEVPIVATAAASSGLFTQLPWAHPARQEGSNVILSPTNRSQADAFATIIPVLPRPIPGRAVHLRPEGAVVVHWALPQI